MPDNTPQVPWTDDQWTRVRKAVQDEAHRARVAATFLPLAGPLPPSTDFVRADVLSYGDAVGARPRLSVDDINTLALATLQVKVYLRGAQMADPDLASALQMFRRAANVLARLEDAIVFNGQQAPSQGPPANTVAGLHDIWEVRGGQYVAGLLDARTDQRTKVILRDGRSLGSELVYSISDSIGRLEQQGHFGPFAVVLGQQLFSAVQDPNKDSLVLPQDRILPFLGSGPLLRSSTLPADCGVVVALGAAPVELVVATDVTLNFLQVTDDPWFVFRVYEKMVLRIKEPDAIVSLQAVPPAQKAAK